MIFEEFLDQKTSETKTFRDYYDDFVAKRTAENARAEAEAAAKRAESKRLRQQLMASDDDAPFTPPTSRGFGE